MTYRIDFTAAARRQFAKLAPTVRRHLAPAIDALAEAPRPPGARKLQDSSSSYRIRIGDYRILYEIHDDRLVVLVVRVAHRREAYRR